MDAISALLPMLPPLMKKATPKAAAVSPLAGIKAQALFDALSEHIWQRSTLCVKAQTTLKARQASGDLDTPAAKMLATLTAKGLQHFKGADGMPKWDPAIAGPVAALLATSDHDVEVGRDTFDASLVLASYWRARGGADGPAEALWFAAKYRAEHGILAAVDPTSDAAKDSAARLAGVVREVLGAKGLRDAESALDGLLETGEWYQRWAVLLVEPTPARLTLLKESHPKGSDWLDAAAL